MKAKREVLELSGDLALVRTTIQGIKANVPQAFWTGKLPRVQVDAVIDGRKVTLVLRNKNS